MKRIIFIIIIFYAFLFSNSNLKAGDLTIKLKSDSSVIDFRSYAQVAIIPNNANVSNNLSLLDRVGYESLSSFKDFDKSEWWLRLKFSNQTNNENWVLTFGDTHDDILVYDNSKEAKKLVGIAGTNLPFSKENKMSSRTESILLHIDSNTDKEIYLNIKNKSDFSKQFFNYQLESFKIYSQSDFESYNTTSKYLNIFFYGAILAMFFYNLVLSFTVHSRGYRAYTTFLFLFFCFNLFTDGFASELFMNNYQLYDRYLRILFGPILIVMYMVFSRIYLNTNKFLPKWDKLIMICILLMLLDYAFFASNNWWLGRQIILLQAAVGCIALIVCSYLVMRKNYLPAKFFLAGNIILIFSTLIYVAYLGSLIPHNQSTKFIEFILQGASIFNMSLFSLGLASRIKVSENDLVEQQRLREHEKQILIEEKNQELEDKINQRTEELKQQKDTIEQINLELERKVRERTKKLQKAYRDLLNLNYELDSFIYRAAHDIRGPISTIMGLCNIALMEKDFQKCQEYLQILDKYSKNTQFTLNRILSVNDLKNNHVKLTHFTWQSLKNSVLALLLNNQDTSKVVVKFNFPLDEDVYSDYFLMQLILQNMIDNAIRFRDNNSGIQPYCNITVVQDETNYIIRIEDNGEGIADTIKEKIFDMFFRGSEYSSGSGLGLYIVKICAKKLNGDVTLISSEKGKTIFELVIPVVREKLSKSLSDQMLKTPVN
ncbi:MAG: 7TM diverse intracellular signaling domain-containing protein [Bacteroidota bacterium]|nr:7TM diverse intracellular signaling domain-containing protein [Bacteroidota bacterium]